MIPNLGISAHYPPFVVADLQLAAKRKDLAAIDRIVDKVLVPDGWARRRRDMSQLDTLREQCSRVTKA